MTTSQIVKSVNTAVAIADDADPFQAFADAIAPQHIVGKLLKFSKGDWLAGENSEPVKQKTFIVGMHALATGWVRWENFKPIEHAMVIVSSGLQWPRRHELGDNDPSTWEIDDRGQKKDPWQFTSYVPMVVADDGEVFTLAASSKGARDAIGKLTRTYAAHRRRVLGELPVVGLASDGYQHPNRAYGYIKTPVILVTGWAAASRFNETMALAGYDIPDSGEPPAAEVGPTTAPAAAKHVDDMNDDIPF
ncbi:hypothetical protein ABIF68_003666 [Bradyrhizobium japonicum]|uniref:hypothetical protein n=1 Tax=Bradyrhizobium TaxID=374 RepID=UPI0004B9027C|nr:MULTISPECIES: hypothetical protein [Bradyrhizobium]MDI2073897.1 hypothetical protein [Bradyrhizobium sp. Mp27]